MSRQWRAEQTGDAISLRELKHERWLTGLWLLVSTSPRGWSGIAITTINTLYGGGARQRMGPSVVYLSLYLLENKGKCCITVGPWQENRFTGLWITQIESGSPSMPLPHKDTQPNEGNTLLSVTLKCTLVMVGLWGECLAPLSLCLFVVVLFYTYLPDFDTF